MYACIILTAMGAYSQNFQNQKPAAFSAHSFYMLCRGTKHKIGFIAQQFNLQDRYSTHVGIGIVENGNLIVYHVINDTGDATALIAEKFNSFVSNDDVVYWSAWECKSNTKDITHLKKLLQSYQSQKIVFDMDFEPSNNKLYCSEFCAEILKKISPKQFAFMMSQKRLDFIYRTALQREILDYYPVDFFQGNPQFKKILAVHR